MAGLSVDSSVIKKKIDSSVDATKIPVICIMGPTATGKTDAAAYLYERIDSEIISVDSSLVYRGMDIGTAKPDAQFLAKYPHHLVDIREPDETYSVADFYQDTTRLVKQITEQGKIPILVGGTMFYFNAIEHGLTQLPEANAEMRAELIEQANTSGWPTLHQRLSELDPVSAQRIEPMDAQRIQRALEINLQSGQTVAWHNANKKPPLPNPLIKMALCFSDRAYLHQRIEQRFDIMLVQGLEIEVKKLLNNGINNNVSAMKMIGYRQMLDYILNNVSHSEMRLKGIAATRQLAKRQLTWLRNQSNIIWWVDFGIINKDFTEFYDCIDKQIAQYGLN